MSTSAVMAYRKRVEAHAIGMRHRQHQEAPPNAVKHDYQTPPSGDWAIWAIIAGRGAGKTFAGSEFILDQIAEGARRVALVGATSSDVRDVMVEGPSGIIKRAEARGWRKPLYQSTRRRVVIYPPGGGAATAFLYSAEEPDRLRGPEHEAAWADEYAAWDIHKVAESWRNLRLGMRIRGANRPRTIVTTTPKPAPHVRRLLKQATEPGSTVVITKGTTRDNEANVSPEWLADIQAEYAGTRIGRQELDGELLEDVEGALWTLGNLDQHRVKVFPEGVELVAVAIGVDPAATSNESSDETGIVAVGAGTDKRGYVLADVSLIAAPLVWAKAAITCYQQHSANFIVVETNNGGEMVTQTLRTVDPKVPVKDVRASRGKQTRAEPVSALYEQGWASHVGTFAQLEEQMTTWVPGMSSPDRMDALVWAFTALQRYIGHQRIGGLI